MSLIKIHNREGSIEMNILEEVRYIPGWNGGSWSVPFKLNKPHLYRFFFNNPNRCEFMELTLVNIRSIWGVDHDQRQQYTWQRIDPIFSIQQADGYGFSLEVGLEEMLKHGTVYVAELAEGYNPEEDSPKPSNLFSV